jgi:beta-galactosidase
MAARLKDDFLGDFYTAVTAEAGVSRALQMELPQGVSAAVRTDGTTDYVFLMNFSGEKQQVELDERSYSDMESGDSVSATIDLPVNGVKLLKRRTI